MKPDLLSVDVYNANNNGNWWAMPQIAGRKVNSYQYSKTKEISRNATRAYRRINLMNHCMKLWDNRSKTKINSRYHA